jgi:hypothetical protein
VVLPADVTIELPPSGNGVVRAAGDARLSAYGSMVSLRLSRRRMASYERALNSVLVPFVADPTMFRVVAVRSTVFRPTGAAAVESAAWALPVTTPAGGGGDLGQAAGVGAMMLAIAPGLTAAWPGLVSSTASAAAVNLGRTFLLVEPGRLAVTAPQARGRRQTQSLALWLQLGARAIVRSTIELSYNQPLTAHFTADGTGEGAEILAVAAVAAVAHLDRPRAADGRRIVFHSSGARLALAISAGRVLAELDAPADLLPEEPELMPLALTNALLCTTPPQELALFGELRQGYDIASGDLFLGFGLRALVPTLPDPYAASFSDDLSYAELNDLPTGAVANAEVQWTTPETPSLTISVVLPPPAAPGPATVEARTPPSSGGEPLRTDLSPFVVVTPPGPVETWWDDLIAQFHGLVGGGLERFRLLDVSGSADQFGVGFGPRPDPAGAPTSAPPLGVRGLDLVTAGNNVRVFTLPAFQWEPVHNIPNPDNPENFPTTLISDFDGGPTQLGINTVALIPVAPVPAVADLVDAYNSTADPRAGAVFTPLPFGMVAVAELRRAGLRPWMAPALLPNIPKFTRTAVSGGLQLSLVGALRGLPPRPQDESRGLAGATVQFRVGKDMANLNNPPKSVLGDQVDDIFNQEFAPGQANPRVPLSRIDLSGYGATCFNDWRNPAAAVAGTGQVRFDVLVGRTAYEVVQVHSLMYPWGVRLVRTITLQRTGGGGVFRRDSGWQAVSDGVYDFRSGGVDPGIIIHPGVVRGLFDIRHIRDTTQVYQRVYQPGDPNQERKVKLAAVRFDADADIEGVVIGTNSQGRVPVCDMLGYVQLEPSGVPLTPAQLDDLMADRGAVGGPIDCVVDIGGSGQRMRVAAIDVARAADPGGNPQLVAAARGPLVLPRAGQWSLTYQAAGEPEPHGLDPDFSLPLIRQNPAGGAAPPYRFADPVDLFRPENPITDYALLQSTDAQRLLFRRPKIEAGDRAITSTLPFSLADAYLLAGSVAMFPRVDRSIPLPAGCRLQIPGQGRVRLIIPRQPGLPANTFLAAVPERMIKDSGSLKVRVVYADENDQPTQVRLVINSDADPDWAMAIGPVSLVTDLDSFTDLIRVVGTFTSQSSVAPKLDPHLVFGGVLQPVQEIINILQKIDLPFPLIVLMKANQVKVGGTLSVPPGPPIGRNGKGIDIGIGRLEGELKVLINLSGEPGQGLLAPQNQTMVDFELQGSLQVDLLPPLPIDSGPAFKFTIEGRAGQSPQIRLFGGGAISVDVDLPLDILDAGAEVIYTYVLQITGGTVGLGVDVEAKLHIDVLDGLASVEVSTEFMALATRLLINAPGGAIPGPTVEMQGQLSFGVEVTLGWLFDIDIEVETEFRTRLNLPLFAAAALLA